MFDWSGMEAAGLIVPPCAGPFEVMMAGLPKRQTCDVARRNNKMGQPLLELCQSTQLVILNGRLPGDCDVVTGGACTFYARGRQAQSLIDYFITSPDLAFDQHGRVKRGCSLQVLVPETLLDCTDHACVSLVIKMCRDESNKCIGPNTDLPERYKYRVEILETFQEILASDECAASFDRIGTDNMSAAESVALFESSLVHALRSTDAVCGKVIAMQREARIGDKPVNAWYTPVCATLREQWRTAQKSHGTNSLIARDASRTYRNATRNARRAFDEDQAAVLVNQWKAEPRTFWRTYKEGSSACMLTDLDVWATYFSALFSANMQGRAYQSLHDHCNMHQLLYPNASDYEHTQASILNRRISEAEVQSALDRFKRHKAPGVDGIPAEFLMHPQLVSPIMRMFNTVLRDKYPKAWSVAALVPIPKPKGNPMLHDDHRGIAVGRAIAKLYSTVMNNRFDEWAEGNGHRAHGQFGFREKKGTLDAAFILRHSIEKYAAERKPLYCAFIDFRKAYDSVDRQLLWRSLQCMGVHGDFLGSLQQMYEDVTMQVRLVANLALPSRQKQG